MTIAVVVAHADDETLGCGGTLAKLAQNERVHMLFLGDGVTSRYGDLKAAMDATEIDERGRIALQAANILGVNTVQFEGLPDNRLDGLVLLEIVKKVEVWLCKIQPEIVLTHSPADLNIDHRLTFQAVLTATRPMPGQTVKELYSFEVPSSTEWAFGQFGQFNPNMFVDITETIETKIAALQCYESEMRPFPHPRSEEALRAIARRWGSVAGYEYAEAFETIRILR